MSVGSILIGLQATQATRRRAGVTSARFLKPLAIEPGEVEATRADGGPWASGMVYFAVIRFSDFAHVDTSLDAGAQSIAFEAGIAEALRKVALFLDRRPPTVTAKMRTEGLSLRLFVEVRMDQDQMELEFPPELVVACGRHSLGIHVISNDIPAEEVLAARHADSDGGL